MGTIETCAYPCCPGNTERVDDAPYLGVLVWCETSPGEDRKKREERLLSEDLQKEIIG